MNFDFTLLFEYLDPRMLIIVVVLWLIGFLLKQTPGIAQWTIIWILLFLGIVAATLIIGLTLEAVVQGIIATAIAGHVHQLIKQSTKKRIEEQNNGKTNITT